MAALNLPRDEAWLHSIVRMANRAPSGDNCQPWLFQWNGERLKISHRDERARHALNVANRASLLALGGVIESVRLAASTHGMESEFQMGEPPTADGVPAVEFRFLAEKTSAHPLARFLVRRHTDRRLFRGGKISPLATLQVNHTGNQTIRLTQLDTWDGPLQRYLCKSESRIWSSEATVRDLMSWIRFGGHHHDGMPWRTLGISFLESRALMAMKSPTIRAVATRLGFLRQVERNCAARLNSSAALFCVSTREITRPSIVEAGRVSFRLWLELNAKGYAVQPMSAGILPLWDSQTAPKDEHSLEGLSLLRAQFGLAKKEMPVWLFRSGLAPRTPLPLCPRLGLSEVFRWD